MRSRVPYFSLQESMSQTFDSGLVLILFKKKENCWYRIFKNVSIILRNIEYKQGMLYRMNISCSIYHTEYTN